MPRFHERWGLPLFVKELTELSGRRQTYVVRSGYASILFLIALVVWALVMPRGSGNVLAVLEIGPVVGGWIYFLQAAGIQWLWPIIACSTFTLEKERNTLPLLLLTRLGPAAIVLEKFFSRLLLVGSFLCLSLPILAFSLGVGGIEFRDLSTLGLVLSTQAIEVTAIALMCSAYCRTTAGSLTATYLVAVLAKAAIALFALFATASITYSSFYGAIFSSLHLTPPLNRYASQFGILLSTRGAFLWEQLFPSFLLAALCLFMARRFLMTRTLTSGTETSIKSFVDRVGRWANRLNKNSVTRGAIVIREGRREPDNDPVAWRETTTRALGQPRYLIGNFLALEFPIIWFLSIVVSLLQGRVLLETIGTMQMYLWIGMLLMITAVVSGMIILERQKQTWETLLVTPLSNRDIVQQKMDGIQRMLWILQAPLWTCMVFRAYHEASIAYILNEASLLLIYPRLVAWIAMTCGILYKNRIQAILMTIATVAGWILAGGGLVIVMSVVLSIVFIPLQVQAFTGPIVLLTWQLCPLTMLILDLCAPRNSNPYGPLQDGGDLISAVRQSLMFGLWNLVLYFGVLKMLRKHCLTVADRNLRGKSSQRS